MNNEKLGPVNLISRAYYHLVKSFSFESQMGARAYLAKRSNFESRVRVCTEEMTPSS
jgi:hypothetical protein